MREDHRIPTDHIFINEWLLFFDELTYTIIF